MPALVQCSAVCGGAKFSRKTPRGGAKIQWPGSDMPTWTHHFRMGVGTSFTLNNGIALQVGLWNSWTVVWRVLVILESVMVQLRSLESYGFARSKVVYNLRSLGSVQTAWKSWCVRVGWVRGCLSLTSHLNYAHLRGLKWFRRWWWCTNKDFAGCGRIKLPGGTFKCIVRSLRPQCVSGLQGKVDWMKYIRYS